MFSRVGWLKPADMAVLNLLSPPNRLELTPNNISRNAGYSRHYLNMRCRMLVRAGLLQQDGDFYSITDLGVDVVNREIDVDDLEELDPEKDDDEE